ncbi:Transcription termination factor MTERF15, mitochondrial [Vitis vinifera]|uniref:Transcription termination factor MTERF15, mitochondrial n=1 Tax=Vitis vinifera TaxID=29760 RepID=A0A438H7U9_VITVI|nr:Transcription termination factor MTERF15, mitochondrial [Vitis vinifera]
MAKLPFKSLLCLMQKRFLTTSPTLYISSLSSSSSTLLSPSYTAQFLVKSCGLPLDSAISISQKLNLDENKPQKHASVLELLKSHGFSNTHIVKLVSRYPLILQSQVDKLKLKVEYLHDNGLVGPVLHELIVSNPNILRRSLDKHIKPSLDFLKEFLETNEKIVTAIKRGSWMLYATERARSLDIKPTDSTYVTAIPVILSMTESTWKRKVELYKKFGLTEVEIFKAIKRQPYFMACSEEKIKSLMNFYTYTMKLKPSAIATYPRLLLYSFDARIQPRFNVLNILASKKLLKTHKKIAWLLTQSEAKFLTNYVNKYLDQVPDLMELYRGVKTIDL